MTMLALEPASLQPSAPIGTLHSLASAAADRSGHAMRTLLHAAGFQLALLLPSLVAYAYDERLINDINIWTKPIKFQLSLMMLMVTIAWLLPLLPKAVRAGRAVRWTAIAMAVSGAAEISYITIQAARGRPSHFNFATPLEAGLYQVMGIGAVLLVLGSAFIGWLIWRNRDGDANPALRFGAAWGLMLGGVLTLVTASIMASGSVVEPGHWVGGIRSDLNGLFLFGWSTTGGDLRVPHFFATHMMQALPILGLFADRLAPSAWRPVMIAGILASLAVVALTFVQAVAGQPFIG